MIEDIPFDEIPTDLQRLIIEKLDHFTFFTLWKANKYMSEMCETEAPKITHPVYILQYKKNQFMGLKVGPGYRICEEPWENFTRIPCRIRVDILEITGTLSDELVEYFIKEFKKFGTRIKELSGQFHATCSVENFDQLLQVTAIRAIETHAIPGKYFSSATIKKMEILLIEHPVHLNSGELQSIKSPLLRLKLPQVSNKDVNQLLKQWRRKERGVVSVTIRRPFTDEDIDEIVEELDANLVWSEGYHQLSKIASLTDVAFPEARLYCLFYPDDIDNIFVLLFMAGSMCFYPDVDVYHALCDIVG